MFVHLSTHTYFCLHICKNLHTLQICKLLTHTKCLLAYMVIFIHVSCIIPFFILWIYIYAFLRRIFYLRVYLYSFLLWAHCTCRYINIFYVTHPLMCCVSLSLPICVKHVSPTVRQCLCGGTKRRGARDLSWVGMSSRGWFWVYSCKMWVIEPSVSIKRS
jgi:hypothetical protein